MLATINVCDVEKRALTYLVGKLDDFCVQHEDQPVRVQADEAIVTVSCRLKPSHIRLVGYPIHDLIVAVVTLWYLFNVVPVD